MTFVLASNSPRRRQLLNLGGWEFTIYAAQVDETPLPGEEPPAYVRRLAESKVRAAAAANPGSDQYLAADTTVVDEQALLGTKILGKPSDEADAWHMLRALRGRVHQVYTALALYRPQDESLLADLCCTDVPMREYSEAEIEAYVASGDPLDKAGAYAIQHAGFHPVESLQGCFANVMGLPLCHLMRLLHRVGIQPGSDLPQACQAELNYDCPVFAAILRGESATANIADTAYAAD
jgi:septum formation protein